MFSTVNGPACTSVKPICFVKVCSVPYSLLYLHRFPVLQVRNEPKNICVSAEYISKIKGVSVETVMEVTTQNAVRLFPKLKSVIRP